MKRSFLALAASAAVVVFAVQVSLPAALAGHASKLKDAQSFKAKVTVNQVGGAPVVYEIAYGKPGSIKIDSPARLVLSDGKDLTVLDKVKNTYTKTPYDKAAVLAEATLPAIWGWASFLEADSAKLFKTAKAVGPRKLRGVDVSEIEVTLPDGTTTATLYIETKTGIARGFQFNQEGKQFIVWAETVEATATAPEATLFAFTAPAGSKMLEVGEIGDVAWADVSRIFTRKCMPCHSGQVRSGGLDLSTYVGASQNRFVTKGESKVSALALALRAQGPKRMPQGSPPLPDAEIKTIEAWIDGGLKQ